MFSKDYYINTYLVKYVNCIFGIFVQDKLKALVKSSQAFLDQPTEMEALWDSCSCLLYSLENRQKQLGLGDKVGACNLQPKNSSQLFRQMLKELSLVLSGPGRLDRFLFCMKNISFVTATRRCLAHENYCFDFLQGITTYFSGNCCLEDAELAQKFLDSKVSWIQIVWRCYCIYPMYWSVCLLITGNLLLLFSSVVFVLVAQPVHVFVGSSNYVSIWFGLFSVFFMFSFRNCLLTTPVCSRKTMERKPAMRCAWPPLCRKVRTPVN